MSRRPPRTPAMLQVQEADCGAVALWIVLAWHGAWIPLPELRERCGVTQFGINAAALVKAASSYGLKSRAVRLDATQLAVLTEPTILFWQRSHFLVLERIDGDRAWLNDPALGHRELSLVELADGYSGIAFPMTPGEDFQRQGEPPRLLDDARELARPAWAPLVGLALLAIVEAVLLAATAHRLGAWLDDGDAGNGWRIALVAAGAALAIAGQGLVTDRGIASVAQPVRDRLLNEMAAFPATFVELRRAPELGGRLRLPETTGVVIAGLVSGGARLIAGAVAWVVALGMVSWLLPVAFVAGIAGALAAQTATATRLRNETIRRQHTEGGRMVDVAGAWERRVAIRGNGEEGYELARLATDTAAGTPPAAPWASPMVAVPLLLGLPVVVAAALAATGDLTAGEVSVACFGALAAVRLARLPAAILRDAATLPVAMRQLGDSRDEVAWRASQAEAAA